MDVISTQKQVQPYAKWLVWKKLRSTGGSQEMAVMVGQWQKFNNDYSGEFCADSWDEATQIYLNCRY